MALLKGNVNYLHLIFASKEGLELFWHTPVWINFFLMYFLYLL